MDYVPVEMFGDDEMELTQLDAFDFDINMVGFERELVEIFSPTPLHDVRSQSSRCELKVELPLIRDGFYPIEQATPEVGSESMMTPIAAISHRQPKRSISEVGARGSSNPREKKSCSSASTPQLCADLVDLALSPKTQKPPASPLNLEDSIAKRVTSAMLLMGAMSIANSIDKWVTILGNSRLWTHLQTMFEISSVNRVWSIIATCGVKEQTRDSVEAVKDAMLIDLNLSKEEKIELTEVYWTCRLGFEYESPFFETVCLSQEQFRLKYSGDLKDLSEADLLLAEDYCNALRVGLCILPGYTKSYKGRLVRMALRVARCENETYYSRSGSKGKFHGFLADIIFKAESDDNAYRLQFANDLAQKVLV